MSKRNVLAALLGTLLWSVAVQAQDFPNKPIRLVVPYPPGGGTDAVARTIVQKLQVVLGQPVVIENKPGASEVVGTGSVARAPADGYTIGLVTSTYSVNWVLDPKLPYKPAQFVAVAPLVGVPLLALVPREAPSASLAELIAASRKRPGTMNYASLGPTSLQAITSEWFKYKSGADLTAVAYKGAAPAMVALSTGEVDFAFAGLGASRAMLETGKVRPIAVSTPKPIAQMPDLPPIAATVPGFDILTWYGVVAPAGVPQPVLARLNAAFAETMNDPQVQRQISAQGNLPMTMGLKAFTAFLERDGIFWREMIDKAGIRAQ
ncbi:Bug family tripartite tricarboxylate transporter substrate binding protein [Cupriavidus oxalaticus]|uniref:Bug family tripartite tricarboxylate transporter substrate binding protein n=1 Tax=Cupriavidus oxalaticus TaxID=96344 RepID=UPI004033D0A8